MLTLVEQRALFNYRTRMNKLKNHFSSKKDELCQCNNLINNNHLYECLMMNNEVRRYKYEKIFIGTLQEQKYIVNIMLKNQEKHEKFTQAQD